MCISIRLRVLIFLLLLSSSLAAQSSIRVIAFYTAKSDQAHISFVHEANRWFYNAGKENNFRYDSTDNWNNLNDAFLSAYDVVLFLDTRPEKQEQRDAFQRYMERGGGWIGFHFAAFALTPSDFPQNWDWYHNSFLGSGSYGSNTWRPTSAILRTETRKHAATKNLPPTFKSAANEWYRWEKDLRKNPDIKILLSIDSTSFPLGTGPKQDEIWHSGYYPVVWTNTRYNMIYLNMGHDDIDYENGTNKSLSSTFASKEQNQLLLNAMAWLGKKSRVKPGSK
jgi:uncharacterized protein